MPTELEVMKMSIFLKVLSDSTRVKILYAIKDMPKSVQEIEQDIDMSQSAVSHQLALLKKVDAVNSYREGNKIYYSANPSAVKILEMAKSVDI